MIDFVEFVHRVYILAKNWNGSVTSWVRSSGHNQSVGGVSNSRHLEGLAVDMVFETKEGKAHAAKRAKEMGLFVKDEKDHLHIGVPR